MKTNTSILSQFQKLTSLLFFCTLFFNLHAQSPHDPNELIIYFEPGTDPMDIADLKQFYNAVEDGSKSPSSYSNIHLWKVTSFPTGNNTLHDINEVIGDARTRAEVNSAGLNYKTDIISFEMPTIPPNNANPEYYCPSGHSLSCGTGSTTIRVGILDTGIGHSVNNNGQVQFYNPSLFTPFYDLNYIGYDYVNNDQYPEDLNSHGSHIAGIIANKGAESTNLDLELFSFRTHNAAGQGEVFDIVRAVDDAIKERMDILNMSFSYMALIGQNNHTEPLEVAIRHAEANEILVLASAGNSAYDNDDPGYGYYPASFDAPNIISIASVNCLNEFSPFSNFGQSKVDIATLGEEVVSADGYGGLQGKSGTSQATAFATAVASMLASNLTQMDYKKVKCAILSSSNQDGALSLPVLTGGVINASQAYDLVTSDECFTVFHKEENPVAISLAEEEKVLVFPNPGQQEFTIAFESTEESPVTLEFFDASGGLVDQIVQTFPTGPQQLVWNAKENAPTGLIMLRLIQKEKIAYFKFYRLP